VADKNYLRWIAEKTPTAWWHDSGDPQEIEQLRLLPALVRAYEPEGMAQEEFITFGATQKTLSQFYHGGWSLLETYEG